MSTEAVRMSGKKETSNSKNESNFGSVKFSILRLPDYRNLPETKLVSTFKRSIGALSAVGVKYVK